MTALFASGVGTLRIFRAVFLAALPIALFVLWLLLDIRPWANSINDELFTKQDIQSEFNSAVAGRFTESNHGDLVFYVADISKDRTKLQQVFVQNRQHGTLGLVVSEEGFQYVDEKTGEHFVVLKNGQRYEGTPGSNVFTIGKFEEYGVRINVEQKQRKRVRVHSLPTSVLLERDDLEYRAELQYRFLLPVAVLVFTIISVPLSHSLPKEGVYGRMVLAILFYLLFVNLMALSGSWMESGITPAWLGRWWVHLLMLALIGIVVFYRSRHFSLLVKRVLK